MYVCMYVCTYVRTYVRTYVCIGSLNASKARHEPGQPEGPKCS